MRFVLRPQAVLCGFVLLIYLAFLTKTYYWDGVLFSLDIESVYEGRAPASSLFHPNHLLYNALGYVVYSACARIWPAVRAITVLQILNALMSVAAAYIVFLLAKWITRLNAAAIFCCVLFVSGATWWKFSTDADSYIVAVLLLLLSALWLLRERPRIVLAALCHAAAMLFHELAIFSYVPVLIWILLDARRTIAKRLGVAVAYCAGTGAVVAAAYWACYEGANHGTYPTLFSWITSYSSDKGFTSSVSDVVSHYLASYLKLFGGGKLTLVSQFFSFWTGAALVLCVGLLFWGARLLARPANAAEIKCDRRALFFLWAWFVAYALFLGLWDPGSAFHKLFLWPAIVLLIGVYGRTRIRALTLLAAALAAWNFAAFIYPHSHTTADPVLVLAKKVNRELPKNATVWYSVLDPDDWYLEYFAPGRQWLSMPDGMDTNSMLMYTAGPVCLETTALARADIHSAIDPKMKWDLVNASHNVRLECLQR